MPSQGYNNYQSDRFEFRRKAQKVFVSQGDVILRLHETDIVRVKANGDVVLSTGGWATHKTMTSMNDALELFGMWVEQQPGTDITRGRWQVTDSDGTVHSYINDKQHYITTFKAKGTDDRQRAQWLAEAYEVPYTLPAAAPAAAPGPRIVSAQPAAASAPAAARSNGVPAPVTVARPPGIGGSWANVAKAANPLYQATTGTSSSSAAAAASGGRVTGPGAASVARTTGPGAAAAPTARTTGPPGFTGSSGFGSSSSSTVAAAHRPQQLAVPSAAAVAAAVSPAGGTAAVMSAPPAPGATSDVLAHLTALGLQDADDDLHMCVVCMEEPRSIVLVPCGHMALCKDCCQQIMANQPASCPMCCQNIEYHVEVDS